VKSRELNLPAALQPLRDAIARLPESDQRTLRLGSVAVAAILILGGWVTVNEKASAAEQRLADRRAQLADLPLRLAELRRGVRLGGGADLPLLTLARQAGELAGVVPELAAGADGSATLQLPGVPFDSLLELVATLEAARVDIRRLRIDAAGAGRVNASLELAPRRS
jgi:type II secretory pathway component PulM